MSLQKNVPLIACLLLALSGTLCVSSYAETPAQKSARATIAALYQKSSIAMMRKDIAPITAMEAADYQVYSPKTGTLNRAQEQAMTRQIFASAVQIPKVQCKITSFKWRGADAVIMAQNTVVILLPQGSKKVRVESVSTSRDYWSRTSRGWQIRQSVHSTTKTWVDGKRIE